MEKKIAILVSGKGTNMKHIIKYIDNGKLSKFIISLVISDRKCDAIKYAINKNIKTFSLKKNIFLSKKIDNILTIYNPNIIVLSGYLSILDNNFCKKWNRKIINIHPSILPKYGGIGMYGKKIHRLVLKNKDNISGATVHFVTKNVDLGEIILQKTCKINKYETIKTLSKKISIIESYILIKSLNIIKKII